MPTLVEIELNSSFSSLRGLAAERDKASNQRGPALPPVTNRMDVGDDSTDIMNDTTLSASMLEGALQDMTLNRAINEERHGADDKKDARHDAAAGFEKGGQEHGSMSMLTNNLPEKMSQKQYETSPFRPAPRRVDSDRSIGPNEALYQQKYSSKINRWIQQGRARYPAELQDYCSMSTSDKMVEQQSVMDLLERLNIRGAGASTDLHNYSNDGEDDDAPMAHSERSQVHFQDTLNGGIDSAHESNLPNSPESASMAKADDTALESSRDTSALLFSPPIQHQSAPKTPISSVRFASKHANHSDSSFSPTGSVEQARAHSLVGSPAAVHRKRMASMSGKRGADQVRIRMDTDTHSDSPTQDFFSLDDNSPYPRGSPMRGISPMKGGFFPASQSPITPRDTSPIDRPRINMPRVPLGDSSDDDSDADRGTPSSDSLTDMMFESSGRNPFNESTRHNIAMKAGAVYHYKALETTNHRAGHRNSFPDPLVDYSGRLGRRLGEIFSRLRRCDSKENTVSRAILVSMAEQQMRDLTLKLLLSNPPMFTSQSNESQCGNESLLLQGQTLIVVRDKETVADWISTFREGSPFSVLDFHTLPVRQRKSYSTSNKLTKYGVVLTTFDALKAADVTHPIDEKGHVIQQTHGDDEGWFQRRSPSQGCCQTKQLTILHALSWHRVIFLDALGRKCYVAKPETSRSLAATALSSRRRYIFLFSSSEDVPTDPIKAIIRSDKKAVSSVLSVLHVKDSEGDITLEQLILDLTKKQNNS